MERIKAFQQTLTGQTRGDLNLIYMNALAELHNYGSRLGCDYRAMTPQERSAFVRRVGKTTLQDRAIDMTGGLPGASARVVGASVLPHMAALEVIDWLLELQETLRQKTIPVLLKTDRDSEQFSQLLDQIRAMFPAVELRSEQV